MGDRRFGPAQFGVRTGQGLAIAVGLGPVSANRPTVRRVDRCRSTPRYPPHDGLVGRIVGYGNVRRKRIIRSIFAGVRCGLFHSGISLGETTIVHCIFDGFCRIFHSLRVGRHAVRVFFSRVFGLST